MLRSCRATLAWSSSNEEVATVDNGVITTLTVGTTTITAATTDGSELTASCDVTVKDIDLSTKTLYEKLDEAPEAGDLIVIYHPTSKNVLSTIANGTKLAGIEGTLYDEKLEILEDMAVLNVTTSEEDQGEGEDPLTVYTFTNVEGKYLTTGEEGNSLTFADEATDCSKWALEDKGNGVWTLMNVGAAYNGNHNQALEYYNGFTTYGVKDTDAFKFDFYGVQAETPDILVESLTLDKETLELEVGK